MRKFTNNRVTMALTVCLLAGCATQSKGPVATAQLTPTKGNTASGTVSFSQTRSTVLVTADIQGLKPNSAHGFHVHEKGDCSSGDGMSTGGHFNPNGQVHGAHGGGAHHAGDFPSLMADANGNAKLTFESSTITLDAGITNIIGRGLIVHRDPDDFKTQPTGNSGPRVACAVIANQ